MTGEPNRKLQRARAIVQALRTGEISAARTAVEGLAEGGTMTSRGQTFTGRDGVFERLAGLWPLMLALRSADWTYEQTSDGAVIAHASFGAIGASPDTYDLRIEYGADDLVTGIAETFTVPKPGEPAKTIPVTVERRINHALAEGKPLTLSYVSDAGEPEISLRGSIQVYSPTQLSAWIRDAKSGLVRSIEAGRTVSMLYRDPASRTTMIIKAKGRISTDEAERKLAFDLSPEVEQRHDLPMNGAAAIFDIVSIKGAAPEGPVNVVP